MDNFTADCAGCIFDDAKIVPSCDLHDGFHVARHAHLMYAQNRARAGSYRSLYGGRVDVVGRRIDVDEYRLALQYLITFAVAI